MWSPDEACEAAIDDPASPARISIESLGHVFPSRLGPIAALDDVKLDIADRQFCCVIGPSGCGKSTLLRILAGLERPTAGRVLIRRQDHSKPLNSMVFQQESLFPWLTLAQNVGYGPRMRRQSRKETAAIVDHYLQITGLSAFARHYPYQLSGGMQQRAAVARAFANDPDILLMDEPFGKLDAQTKVILQEEVLKIWDTTRKTVVFVTHSIDEAISLGDVVVVMTARPGRIKAIVPVELPRPREVYELRANETYNLLFSRLWDLLRDEVAASRRDEAASNETASEGKPHDESDPPEPNSTGPSQNGAGLRGGDHGSTESIRTSGARR